jgi:hypothetical protein
MNSGERRLVILLRAAGKMVNDAERHDASSSFCFRSKR